MRWKAFGIAAAVILSAALLPLAALADNPPGTTTTTQRPARQHAIYYAGAVTSANSGSLTVDVLLTGKHDQQLDGKQVTASITSSTQIVFGRGQSSIDPGDLVEVRAIAADASLSSLTAARIHVNCNCHWVGGTLTAISPGMIRVKVAKTGPYDTVLNGNEVKFDIDSSTQFVEGRDKHHITISDLSIGDKVGVVFSANGFFRDPNFNWHDATFTAKLVHLHRDKGEASTAGGDGAATTNGQGQNQNP